MWEGEVNSGIPNGFIRVLDADGLYNFVGYSQGWNNRYGTGLFFEDDQLAQMGFYMDGDTFENNSFDEFKVSK